jgi:hypothetical protein
MNCVEEAPMSADTLPNPSPLKIAITILLAPILVAGCLFVWLFWMMPQDVAKTFGGCQRQSESSRRGRIPHDDRAQAVQEILKTYAAERQVPRTSVLL